MTFLLLHTTSSLSALYSFLPSIYFAAVVLDDLIFSICDLKKNDYNKRKQLGIGGAWGNGSFYKETLRVADKALQNAHRDADR
jgi:hypothetical protein